MSKKKALTLRLIINKKNFYFERKYANNFLLTSRNYLHIHSIVFFFEKLVALFSFDCVKYHPK